MTDASGEPSARRTVDPRAALSRAAVEVAPEGTDPQLLGDVVAWLVAPRHGPTGLRRAVLRQGADEVAAAFRAALPDRPDADQAIAATATLRRWAELGCRVALVGDPAFPARLSMSWGHHTVPPLLAWRGELGDGPAAAIVGARRATSYGTGVAAWLAGTAARAGVRVVSGGAVGIDASAHRAAVDELGATTVVLGCGHGIGYPRVHATDGGLFDRVVGGGGAIVSELLPDQPPNAGHVRERNRVVAGISDLTVVVEGGQRSGALLTAGAAAEQSRTVLAVPGDVRAAGSAAPHRLLQEGAGICTHPRDLLEALGRDAGDGGGADRDRGATHGTTDPRASSLPQDVHRHLVGAWPRSVLIDDLAAATGRATGPLLAAVTRAQVAGELTIDAEGVRLRRR